MEAGLIDTLYKYRHRGKEQSTISLVLRRSKRLKFEGETNDSDMLWVTSSRIG